MIGTMLKLKLYTEVKRRLASLAVTTITTPTGRAVYVLSIDVIERMARECVEAVESVLGKEDQGC